MMKLLPLILTTFLLVGCEVVGTNEVHIEAKGLNFIPVIPIDLSQMPESSYTLHESGNDQGLTSIWRKTSITLNQPARIILVPIEE